MKNCNCKITLKKEHAIIKTHKLVSRPVHLGQIAESDFKFFMPFFPEAFEIKCECKKENKKDK